MGPAGRGRLRLPEEDHPARPRRQREDDIVIATVNSFILQQNLPDAQLILYPGSGHGAHFQYPESFATQARLFLDG